MKSTLRAAIRTAIAASAIGGLLLGASACSSGGSGGDKSSGPVTISYAFWDPNMPKAFQAAADTFHKENPKITVKLRQVPFDHYFTKLNTQIRSKSAPDVFWLQNIQFPLYAENGALADLSGYRKSSTVDLSGIPDSVMKTYESDGKLYAVPWQVITFGLYFNKALFAGAGMPLPTNDWTWDDVAAAAAKLTDKAKGTYGIVSSVWNYGEFYQTMYANGAKIITDHGKSTDFDSPAAIKGLDFWVSLSRNGYSPTVAQLTDTNRDQWFESGKIAMISNGSWNASIYAKALGKDLGIVEEPSGKVDTSGAATTANAVSASSKHPEAAYKWAEFLASPEGQKIINTTAGAAAGAPANSAANQAWLGSTGTPDAKVFLSEIAKATPLPATKNTEAWEDKETTTLTPAWNGQKSTAEVAKEMAEIIKKQLAQE